LAQCLVLSLGAAMRRREFISLIVGATTWPLVARAQRAGKPPVIGVVVVVKGAVFRPFAELIVQRLGELGWVVGRDVVVEYRYAEGSIDRAGEAAAEFARMKVDVIFLGGDSEALAAKRATVTIPIVVASVGDPVGNGLIESLAHPGGNITGMSLALSETAGKRLELLREVVPGLKRVAIFGNSGNSTVATERNAAIAAAHALGFDTIISGVQTEEDIAPTIESLKGNADALYVCEDPFTVAKSATILAATLAARLPTMRLFRISTERGGLGRVDKLNPDSDAGKQHEGGEALDQLVVASSDTA
jgi:putative tryptophan/tyrosine transport system substrate-binding protein